MFDLPGLDGVEEVVINREVAEGAGQSAVHLRQGSEERAETQRLRRAVRAACGSSQCAGSRTARIQCHSGHALGRRPAADSRRLRD